MKEGADLLPTSASAAAAKGSSGGGGGGGGAAASEAALLGKGRYKLWALGAIVLLAFWSMLTGTVTLKWSAGDLARFSDDLDNPLHDDLDVLEMEEREKMVRHLWDVYAHSERIRLPRFWQQAFEAAYEELAGDDARVRDAAVAEIARMSLRMVDLEPPPRHRRRGGDRPHGPKNTEMENKQRDSSSRSEGKSTTLLSTGA